MKLTDLLKVMDLDTRISIQHKYSTIYEGVVSECEGYTFLQQDLQVNSVWYSTVYNAIMIEC